MEPRRHAPLEIWRQVQFTFPEPSKKQINGAHLCDYINLGRIERSADYPLRFLNFNTRTLTV